MRYLTSSSVMPTRVADGRKQGQSCPGEFLTVPPLRYPRQSIHTALIYSLNRFDLIFANLCAVRYNGVAFTLDAHHQ